jgi:steroid 5-alpha reductase family enzyme
MGKKPQTFFYNLLILAFAAAIAFACSQNTTEIFGGIPIFAVCYALAFTINWLAFIPAYIFQTEKFFDLTGSISFITVTATALWLAPERDVRTWAVSGLVLIWALRLGSFLFIRILKEGKDGRFDELKPNFLNFLIVWTLQGLWVNLTLATALVIICSPYKIPLDFFAIVGIAVWLLGFVIEVVSDTQKSKWRANPENKGKFINTGLWSISRHPNYLGEIIIWIGIAIIAVPILQGWQYFALISPLFVILLLTRISGIPLLEKRADEKWGGTNDYENYKKNTALLIPKLFAAF